jgi:pimeloyl-ACP methyl ester carboxylesterase
MILLSFQRWPLGRIAVALVGLVSVLPAQTPPPPAKRLPPAGVAIPAAAQTELAAGADALKRELDALSAALRNHARLVALLPDVEIYHKAVDWALRYDEFFDVKHVDVARHLLKVGQERAAQLRRGQASWTEATGLVIRGYRSQVDDSVQPYALVIPADWKPDGAVRRRLDVVLPGRGEKRTELAFIDEHEKKPGEIVPAGAIVLHPYGRYCNATKFAGETDVLEAMEQVRAAYGIDANRIVVRGFSMGGASTWHLAVHHPDLWAAAAPGAGFAETAAYTKALAPGKPPRMPWEQTLWRWYDATGYAANLQFVPTIAYSGEIDPQKQAADMMEKALAAEGLKLEHLIGPQTAHKYHPETKAVLASRLDEIAARGREEWPAEDHLTTYTPRYATSRRIRLAEMETPWERADIHVRFPSTDTVEATTRNVTMFSVRLPKPEGVRAVIDGQSLTLGRNGADFWLVKDNGRWSVKDAAYAEQRWRNHGRKIPGLSGPVDDAFLQPFLFIRPTGKPLNAVVAAWTAAELKHAVKMWRDIFRGDVLIKDDRDVTPADMETRSLVLWGDASSNTLLARLLVEQKLPLTWTGERLTFRGKTYDAAHHAPVLIFPNPLAREHRYIVLNSGIDFREEAYGTNALQTPKLPDFAIIDLREPPGPRWPGKIVEAGFFDSAWK